MSGASPISLAAGAGELLWYDGGLVTFKATGEQTEGALLLFEARMPRGKATPLHAHPADETLYLLDGEILLHVDGVESPAATGAVAVIPRGVPHAFAVVSEEVRLLVAFTPADDVSEAFFRALGRPADAATLPPPSPPDLDRIRAAAQETGLQVLGPPPFPSLSNA